jgi:hypothetical protein
MIASAEPPPGFRSDARDADQLSVASPPFGCRKLPVM